MRLKWGNGERSVLHIVKCYVYKCFERQGFIIIKWRGRNLTREATFQKSAWWRREGHVDVNNRHTTQLLCAQDTCVHGFIQPCEAVHNSSLVYYWSAYMLQMKLKVWFQILRQKIIDLGHHTMGLSRKREAPSHPVDFPETCEAMRASQVALVVKNSPANAGRLKWSRFRLKWSLVQEDPLEEEMATHSSILAWRIPWTEEPGGLQSTGSQRVSQTRLSTHTHVGPVCCDMRLKCKIAACFALVNDAT